MAGCGTCLVEWVDLSQIAEGKGARKAQKCVSPSMPAHSMLERSDAFNGCGGHTYDLQLKMQWIGQRGVDEGLLNLLVQPVVNFSPNH